MGHISGLPMTYGFMMFSSLHLFYRCGIPNITRLIRCLLRPSEPVTNAPGGLSIRAHYVDAKVATDFDNDALTYPFELISNFGYLGLGYVLS